MPVALGVNGGVLGSNNLPSSGSAKGIWTPNEVARAIALGYWPTLYARAIAESASGADALIASTPAEILEAIIASDLISATGAADPYFEYTTLLLPGNGTNGAQNNLFLDSGSAGDAVFTASISNTTMTVSAVTSGTIYVGCLITGSGVLANTTITAFVSGTSGGIGVYTVSQNQGTVASTTITSDGFPITRNGNTTQGTFSPFSQTGWGNYFDGSGDQLTVANNSAFNFGSGDFTVEAWCYFTGSTGSVINYSNGQSSNANFAWEIYQVSATSIQIAIVESTTSYAASSTALVANAWNHVAGVRSGNTLTVYVNGVAGGTTANVTGVTVNNPASATVKISGYNNATSIITGYVSNARIVKGTAVYTSNFTTPITPLTAITNTSLLTCQSNRFVDNSASPKTITVNGSPSVVAFSPFNPTSSWSAATNGGSGYFDGTGDYLQTATASAFQLGSSNFTIETWVYQTTTSGSQGIIASRTGAVFDGVNIYTQASGTQVAVLIASSSGAWGAIMTSSTLSSLVNRWAHVALVRNGTTATLYVDGVSVGSTTVNFSIYQSANRFFAGTDGNGSLTGYLSNSRIVKGTAVYTGAFTPPTAPITNAGSTSAASYPSTTNVNTSFASSECSLLLNFTNAGIYDATSKNDLETVGNAQISTAISAKWGSGSMYFDGTGDYLQSVAKDLFAFGTGDYTVETWVYFTSINSTTLQIIFMSGSTGGNNFYCHVDSDQISVGTTAAFVSNQVSSFSTGVWYHIAFCRASGTLRLFKDGVQQGSSVTDSTNWISAGNARCGANESGTQTLFGYLQDLRITKYARYTANFTPPTAAFPTL